MSKTVHRTVVNEGEELPCPESNILSASAVGMIEGDKLLVWYVESEEHE